MAVVSVIGGVGCGFEEVEGGKAKEGVLGNGSGGSRKRAIGQ